MTTETVRISVGAATITSVVEDEVAHIPPELFFPDATAATVARHPWLVPDFADDAGNITLRVQAFVVELAGRTVLVDPCVGNGKVRALPFWNEQSWPFLDRFVAAGFAPDAIDLVGAVVLGTHFGSRPIGHVVANGDVWSFEPL